MARRDGADAEYTGVFLAWALLLVCCLGAWTAAALSTARRLRLDASTLRVEACLAAAVACAMAVMTVATVAWWASLAHDAPWFFAGRPLGAAASALDPKLVAASALMLAATLLAGTGAVAALRGLPELRSPGA